MTVLVGDVGATTCRLALARIEGDRLLELGARAEIPSAEHPDLGAAVARYLETTERRPGGAVLGVAAPVREGRARFANLPWDESEDGLSRRLGFDDVRLLNDFEALCHALPLLGEEHLVELYAGAPEPEGTVAVLGAGTGLGHGFVTRDEGGYRVHSSEAGHVEFGPTTPVQDALLGWLRRRHGRVSCEHVVSGPGLFAIYRFLVDSGRADEEPETRDLIEAGDPPAVISERGLEGSDAACRRALEIFVSAFGAHAGNFALAVQATGGVYLGGGIAPKVLPALRGEGFRKAFLDKGPMTAVVESIPVRVITDPDAGLLGAARAALG